FPGLSTQIVKPTFAADNATLQGVYTNQVVVDALGNTVFQNAPPGRVGNMSLNAVGMRGPGMLTFNAAITKSVKFAEGKTFSIRADAVNVLNRTQWGNPSTNVNGTTFGRITSVVGNIQRLVTLNARIDF